MSPDFVNGSFEFLAGFLNLMHTKQLLKHKMVRGVSIWPVVFFTSWGLWNMFYYPWLDQWWSFWGGLFVCSVNAINVSLMWKYRDA